MQWCLEKWKGEVQHASWVSTATTSKAQWEHESISTVIWAVVLFDLRQEGFEEEEHSWEVEEEHFGEYYQRTSTLVFTTSN